MARQSVNDVACAKLDAKIAEHMREIDGLIRAKQIIVADEIIAEEAAEKKPRKPRGPNKKRGLPAQTASNGE